jgi:hypothetical protein
MRTIRIFAWLVMVAGGLSPAEGQTVIVPETTYSFEATTFTKDSTAFLDIDSVIMVFTEYGLSDGNLGSTQFQVVNVNTGAVELAPVPLPYGFVQAAVAVLQPDSALIVVRDDDPLPSTGKYFIVNPLTGVIVRGPILFSSNDFTDYHVAVADPSTVLIAYRSEFGVIKGQFIVVNPQTGAVKVPEKLFYDGMISSMDVEALDSHKVAIVFDHPTNLFLPSSFMVVDPQTGAIVAPPVDLDGSAILPEIRKLNSTDVLITYGIHGCSGELPSCPLYFIRANTVTGLTSAPTQFTTEVSYQFTTAVLGADSAVFAYGRDFTSDFTVHNVNGPKLVPQTSFHTGGPSHFLSATASGCRVFLSYHDVNDGQKGKFKVLDFSSVCTARPCPTDVTDHVEIFRSALVAFYFPFLQLQLVLVQNRTAESIPGPVVYVIDSLENALAFSTTATTCLSAQPAPFLLFHTGADKILSPNEIAGGFLLFVETAIGPITYTPRILSGVPPR